MLMDDRTIRVYVGFRDNAGVSRIGYVDVDAANPSKVLSVSKHPVLDIGKPGTFDDNGVILGDVIHHEGKIFMFYIGFQLTNKAKFLAFTGLAVSKDGGDSFERVQCVPIMDRADEGYLFRAIHSVMIEEKTWRIWYATGSEWVVINNMPYPSYDIKYLESRDGLNFENKGKQCIQFEGDEYRIGRPRVYKHNGKYIMFYTKGTTQGHYTAGYAESDDGINWLRKDSSVGIGLSPNGWDSTSLSYPSLMCYKDKTYMFYNGNEMGKTGFGYAELKG